MEKQTYYKIADNRCDTWKIVKTNYFGEDCYKTFAEAKKELKDIFLSAIKSEKEAIVELSDLKAIDVEFE